MIFLNCSAFFSWKRIWSTIKKSNKLFAVFFRVFGQILFFRKNRIYPIYASHLSFRLSDGDLLQLPDIGLTTLNEVAERGKQIARVTNLPCIIDADTGFGEPMNVARTVLMFEEAGLAGLHLEDQMNPKRCGHLDNKKLCSTAEMVQKIQTAVKSKRDKNFLIIARTDARAVEGIDKTLERIRIYEDAGAEMIFPEAMQNEKEFEQVRKVTSLPLLANMTEFGKSELLDKKQLENLGYQMVIYPVTTWRLAIGATVAGLKEIKEKGHQKDLLEKMQTRKELYDILQYENYNKFDKDIFNFKI